MSTTRPAQSVVAGEGVHPTEPDDWIQRVGANGDRPAFMALFDHFAPRMKAYLLQSGMIEGDADDVAQETLLAVWRTAGQFDPETDDAATWIFKLARNLRSDLLRRQRVVGALRGAQPHYRPVICAAPSALR